MTTSPLHHLPAPRYGVAASVCLLVLTAAVSGCGASLSDQPPAGQSASTSSSPSAPVASPGATVSGRPSSLPPVPSTAPNAVPSGQTGTPRGGIATVASPTDVAQVAQAVTATMYRYDTALDTSPQDAARRAARWMTPALADRQRSAVTSGGGAWWLQLAAGHGWTSTATAMDTEPPPDLGPTRAVRRVFVTLTPHTASGAHPPAVQRYAVALMLTRPAASAAWQADEVTVQPQAGDTP